MDGKSGKINSMDYDCWHKIDVTEGVVEELMKHAGVPHSIALTLGARGITYRDYSAYVSPRLNSLSDPFLLPGVKSAAERIWNAISNRERILIYGDYDTDGITSTAVLLKILGGHGADVSYFLPHRFDDGYGFITESLDKVIPEKKPSLIITVDCGINGVEAVKSVTDRGIDVIITDHHEPGEVLPDAFAVINPKIHKDMESLSLLAGVGISFKLCHGFIKYGLENNLGGRAADLKKILDLVALGTVADIVPLLGENRILVNAGLKVLDSQIRPGIRALCEAAHLESTLKPSHIAFNLAPRLNAAGRFGSPEEAFRLLATDNIVEAYQIAEALDSYNNLRKKTEMDIYLEASASLRERLNPEGVLDGAAVVAGEKWHMGVIGIVASRLSRDYFRPSIVLSIDGDTASGSGRSVGDISLIDLLNDTSEYLIRYGGHPMAAGLSLKTADIPDFFNAFNQAVKKYSAPGHFRPSVDFDGEVVISEFDDDFFIHLEKLSPFGCGNREPSYRINALMPENLASAAEKHTRGVLTDRDGVSIQFIAFNRDISSMPSSYLWDVIATPQINSFRGMETPQLQIIDIRDSGQ